MSRGFVYVLSNPSMPGIVKIGKTTRSVEQRAFELYQTGVPTPFVIMEFFFSPDCSELEQLAHEALSEFRVSQGREFFAVDPEDARKAIFGIHREQITDWLDQFLPDYIAVESGLVLSDADIFMMADQTESHPYEVIAALETITADEVTILLERWRALVRERAERRAEVKAAQN